MTLELGKSFNRQYTIRIPIQGSFYDIGIFLNKKTVFTLFDVKSNNKNLNVSMFKNIQGSKFCETFLDLHSYRKKSLDIINQFEKVKDEITQNISFLFNENIRLSIVDIDGRELYDVLTVQAFTIDSLSDEFVFILVERQCISKELSKKIVRTTGCQISSNYGLGILDKYHNEYLEDQKNRLKIDPNIIEDHEVTVIKLT